MSKWLVKSAIDSLEPVDTFVYKGKKYPVWSSFESHYKPMDSEMGKFNRYAKLGKIADDVELNLRETIETTPFTVEGRCAYACLLMMTTGIRVGNESSAELHESGLVNNLGEMVQTFGVSTLLPEHIEVSPSGLKLNFLGKKEVEQNIEVNDPLLIRVGVNYLDKAVDNVPTWIGIDLLTLTKYIKSILGPDFIPKDLRTFCGNVHCFDIMRNYLDEEKKDKKTVKQELKDIVSGAASKLGNTPGVTKSSYLDSRMLDWYLNQRTFKEVI